jgi:hypothetical protein
LFWLFVCVLLLRHDLLLPRGVLLLWRIRLRWRRWFCRSGCFLLLLLLVLLCVWGVR